MEWTFRRKLRLPFVATRNWLTVPSHRRAGRFNVKQDRTQFYITEPSSHNHDTRFAIMGCGHPAAHSFSGATVPRHDQLKPCDRAG